MLESENPNRYVQSSARNRLNHLPWFGSLKVTYELNNVVWEVVPAAMQGPAHRLRGDLIGTGGVAKPQVNAAGMQCGQRAELLGDQPRRMVRQHDPAGAAAAIWASATAVAAACDPGQVMMFSHQ